MLTPALGPACRPLRADLAGLLTWISGHVLLASTLSLVESVFRSSFGPKCAFLSGKRISEKGMTCFFVRGQFVMISFTDRSLVVKQSYLFTRSSKLGSKSVLYMDHVGACLNCQFIVQFALYYCIFANRGAQLDFNGNCTKCS